MKTFENYYRLREIAAYDVGASVLGRASLDADSEKAITAAFQAFEIIMAKNPQRAVSFLNQMTESMPEIKAILQQNGLESFKDQDFKNGMRRAAMKGRKVVTKGLGDVTPADGNNGDDVIATPTADSFHNPIG